MKILCVVTDSHKKLFEEYFIKTVPNKDDLVVKNLDLKGVGRYKTKSWQKAVNEKTKFIVSCLKEGIVGDNFIFSDVDIQFFPNFSFNEIKKELDNSGKEILFQKENKFKNDVEVNTGFYIAKNSENILKFFECVREELDKAEVKSDQKIINNLLESYPIDWGFLSYKYYAWSHGFPPPESVLIHHANATVTIKQKIEQLKLLSRYYYSNNLLKIYYVVKVHISIRVIRLINIIRTKWKNLI